MILSVANPSPLPAAPPLLQCATMAPAPEGFPLHNLTATEIQSVQSLQTQTSAIFTSSPPLLTGTPLPGEEQWATSNDTALRYLKACKFDVGKAYTMVLRSLQWRREYRPTEITPEDVEEESRNGKMFWSGFDRAGRPIFNLDAAKVKSTDTDRYLKLIVFNLERGVALCPGGVYQLTTVADVSNVSLFNQNPVSVSVQTLSILQAHYPERLGCTVVMDPSWTLWALWAVLSPFIDSGTRSKIYFTNSKDLGGAKKTQVEDSNAAVGTGGWLESVDKLIDPSQLAVSMGGSYSYAYDHATYWKGAIKYLWK
ncbi:CRAL-TRIO domain-containing protein [Chytriomyces cf. hyalinus JEL632]|nr:CRAL-TRIO domain-containing protein [Chytriomyces cf. hyalinus JEL632]